MTARYAIYFAPKQGSRLDELGKAWLGRCAWSGGEVPLVQLSGLAYRQHRKITDEPRRYGFHGTLKPPFALTPGATETDLKSSLQRFADGQKPFEIPKLALTELGNFLALTPASPSEELNRLAAECVRLFDVFRAPLTEVELAQRRVSRLTARQSDLLLLWGYPYVLDEFRFHLTLTGRIEDELARGVLCARLKTLLAPTIGVPIPFDAVTLFRQTDRSEPFRIIDRYPFKG